MNMVEKDAIYNQLFTFDKPTSQLIDNFSGCAVTSKYAEVKRVGYTSVDDIKAGIIRHKNREIKAAQKQPVTSREKRRELREARQEQLTEKQKAALKRKEKRQQEIEFFDRIDRSSIDYQRKINDALSIGDMKLVGAMIHLSEKKRRPIAYAEGYGYFSTDDGIHWHQIRVHYRFIKHRAPAHRNSRGEAMILINKNLEPTKNKRLGGNRASISGWTQEEFEAATSFIKQRRESTNS